MPYRRPIGIFLLGLGSSIFVLTLTHAVVASPETEITPPPQALLAAGGLARPLTMGDVPAHVSIPSAEVSAKVQARGLVAGNRMAAPTNYTDIGWYKYGTVPGAAGTAVMYGHLDNGLGLTGVFMHLDQVKIGDTVDVTTESGETLHFKVTDLETYPYLEVPPEVLGQGEKSNEARISFITCAGESLYDKNIGFTYDHRFVVTATYVGKS